VTRSPEEVDAVLNLVAAKCKPGEIARRTGLPRPTIYRWISGRTPGQRRRAACMRCTPDRFSVFRWLTESAYAYLLGVYLGDGCLSTHPRGVFRLEIALDGIYPRVIAECEAATSLVMPSNLVSVKPRVGNRAVDVSSYSQHWHCLFSATWPRAQAPSAHRTRRVATRDRRSVPASAPPRPDPFGRLPGNQHDQASEEDVLISPLPVLESLGRHPGDLLRVLRQARDRMAADEPVQHLRRPGGVSRPDGRVHRPEALTAIRYRRIVAVKCRL
jgi:hypothetical protein